MPKENVTEKEYRRLLTAIVQGLLSSGDYTGQTENGTVYAVEDEDTGCAAVSDADGIVRKIIDLSEGFEFGQQQIAEDKQFEAWRKRYDAAKPQEENPKK